MSWLLLWSPVNFCTINFKCQLSYHLFWCFQNCWKSFDLWAELRIQLLCCLSRTIVLSSKKCYRSLSYALLILHISSCCATSKKLEERRDHLAILMLFSFCFSDQSGSKSHHMAIAFGASFGAAFLVIVVIGLLVWQRYRHNQQIFFDVNG